MAQQACPRPSVLATGPLESAGARSGPNPPRVPTPVTSQAISQAEPVRAVPAFVMFATRSRSPLHRQPIPLTGTFPCTLDEHRSLVLPVEVMKQLDDTEHRMIPFIEKFRSIREAVKQFGRI